MLRRAIYSRRLRLPVAAALAAVVAAALVLSQSGSAGATVTTLKTFTTPGAYTWTVPTGVTNATFDVFGARGGSVLQNNHGIVTVLASGGAGGEAKAKFAVHAGEVFMIVVGGQGGTATYGTTAGSLGINGGGHGSLYAGGGGGASDVRLGGRGNLTCGNTVLSCTYIDRIIVGGGGGGGGYINGIAYNGRCGGGLSGCSTSEDLATGTQCSGTQQGSAFSCDAQGAIGLGADFGASGGGGGGLYGGGSYHGGGGGSGYISPFSKTGSFPGGQNQGDGKVIITTTT